MRVLVAGDRGQQRIGEGRARSVHLDGHAVAGRLIDLTDLDRVRTIESSQLCCAHGTSVVRLNVAMD